MKSVLLKSVRFYKKNLSPLKPRCCRYYPSCSDYALTAIERYGALKGSALSLRRILRCNPLFQGGYDPVPQLPESVIRRDENQ